MKELPDQLWTHLRDAWRGLDPDDELKLHVGGDVHVMLSNGSVLIFHYPEVRIEEEGVEHAVTAIVQAVDAAERRLNVGPSEEPVLGEKCWMIERSRSATSAMVKRVCLVTTGYSVF